MCEGKRDLAFLKFLRSGYTAQAQNAPKITVQQAYGKGGNNVIKTLLGKLKNSQYDYGVAFVEADVPPDAKHRKLMAQNIKGCEKLIVEASPCLEGLFLKILDAPVPETTARCKAAIEEVCDKELYCHTEYQSLFDIQMIERYLSSVEASDDFNVLVCLYRKI